jgi:hypothetical protein
MKFRRSDGNILESYTLANWTNQEEIDKFLSTHDPPRDVNHLNKYITSDEIEIIIKPFPTRKRSGLDGFMAEFYQTFNEKLT